MLKVGDRVVLANMSGEVTWVSPAGYWFDLRDDESGDVYRRSDRDIVAQLPEPR